MAFGLLGGEGAGDPLDLYGDLFSDKQKAALRQRELSSGLLRFAEKLGQASAPSRAPKGSFLGLLGQSLGGFAGGDEAANKQLEAMALAEKVRASKQKRELAAKTIPFFWKVAGGGIVQGTSDTPPAPGAVPLGPAPANAPAGQPPSATAADAAAAVPLPQIGAPPGPQTGPMPLLPMPPAPPGGRITPTDYGVPQQTSLPPPQPPERLGGGLGYAPGGYGWRPPVPVQGNAPATPGPQSSLLPPPPGLGPQMGAPGGVLSADLYGGGTGSPLPFSGGGLPPGAAGPEDVGAGGEPDVVIPSGPRLQRSDLVNVAASGGGGYGASREGTVAYWRSRGAPEHVAQGIADRVNAESGFRPGVMGDKGTSGGLYQHHADRLARLQRFAAAQGKEWTDPDVQHRFAGSETEGGDAQATRGMPAILAAPDRQTAAKLWDRHFERSAAGPGSGGGQGPGSGIYDPNRRIGITPLSGEAAPAGQGGVIPGLNMTPQQLGAFNALFKMSGLGDPFGSLLETYYKSPGYLTEAARARAQGENDPLIIEQKKRTEYKIDTELKPKLEVAVAWAMNAPLKERAQAEAEIARITKQYEQAGAAGTKIEEATIAGEDGKPVQKKMTALEIAIRQKVTADRQASERQATGQITVKPGDIVGTPVLSPEETARQTKRGTTAEEMREIEVWTPTGPVKQTMSNQEIAAREKLAASRGPGGAPQIGDIISKPALTPADQKIADSLGEEFIATRKQALAADKTIRDTHNLRSKLDSGMFTGLDANLNLFMARLGDTLGWKNLSDPEKVKNTETYIAGLGAEVLAMVSALRPASNIDLDFARSMAGGQNLSAASIRQLLDMREEYARLAIQRHNEEAAGRNPAIFQGARRELPIPPAYQPKELTSPGGNKVIINR